MIASRFMSYSASQLQLRQYQGEQSIDYSHRRWATITHALRGLHLMAAG